MLAMDRIAEARVSPDGRLVAFSVSVTDLAKNRRHSSLYLAATDGSFVRRLTAAEASDSQPRWSPDGKAIFFVSSRSGSAQVWRIALDGGEAEQVTRMPLDVDALEVGPGARFLVFSMAVFPGKTPEETRQALDAKEQDKASGMLFDHLFIRHWDTWENGTRNHLFAYNLAAGKATDLMAGDGRGLSYQTVRRQRRLRDRPRRHSRRVLRQGHGERPFGGGVVHELRPFPGPG